MTERPAIVAHADWSVRAEKRWLCVASRAGDRWSVRCEAAGPVGTLLDRLVREAAGGAALLGVDAAIGLPRAYAARHAAGAADFPDFLARLPPGAAFFDVCDGIEEVGPARPFFPRTGRGRPRRGEQAARLGLDGADALLRVCDRRTPTRPAACPLFWTLGPSQVGRASLSFWQDVLRPALAASARPLLWPFDGELPALLAPGRVVVAETYPAEAMRQLGLAMAGSKRRQADRLALAAPLLACLARLGAQTDARLAAGLADGFADATGAPPTGEDRFDSLLGLLGLLQAIAEPGRCAAPASPAIRRWEGWILGQAPLS